MSDLMFWDEGEATGSAAATADSCGESNRNTRFGNAKVCGGSLFVSSGKRLTAGVVAANRGLFRPFAAVVLSTEVTVAVLESLVSGLEAGADFVSPTTTVLV